LIAALTGSVVLFSGHQYPIGALTPTDPAQAFARHAILVSYTTAPPRQSNEQVARALKYSPDGRWLAIAEGRRRVRVWDAKYYEAKITLTGFNDLAHALGFTPNGARLFGGCSDGRVYIWDVNSATLLKTLDGHRWALQGMAVASDWNTLATGAIYFDKDTKAAIAEVKVFDVNKGTILHDFGPTAGISIGGHPLALSPDGKLLAVANVTVEPRDVKLWDVATGKEVQRFAYESGVPMTVALAPDGNWLAVGGRESKPPKSPQSKVVGNVKVWARATGKLHAAHVDTKCGEFREVAFSPDSKYVFTGSPGPDSSSVVHCWQTNDWSKVWTADQAGGGNVWALDVSPDGRFVAVSDATGTGLIDAATGKWARKLITVD
jgi:WD40 repeat protein